MSKSNRTCSYSFNITKPSFFARREINHFPLYYKNDFETKATLYSRFSSSSRRMASNNQSANGGVFGLDFSPDGGILGAAMEKKSLLFFDPLNQNVVASLKDAHGDCSNAIRFLDNRIFVSCSDDNLAKLWDLRFLKSTSCIRTFRGHTNWVKNIEYDSSKGILLTSGFDGFVYSWDLNSYYENSETEFKKVFYTPGLMRAKLTPDHEKLILSTHWGYLLVIHNFDVNRCDSDLVDFKPNMYWIMLKSGAKFVDCDKHLRHFSAPVNCVELIIDFPLTNDPDNIMSIAPHPQNWCVLSRNTNHDDNSEWTCLHDIQTPTMEELREPLTINNRTVEVPAICLNANGEPTTDQPPRVVRTTTTDSGRTIIAIDMYPNDGAPSSSQNTDSAENNGEQQINRSNNDARQSTETSSADDSAEDSNSDNFDFVWSRQRFAANESRAIFLPQDAADPQRRRMVLILSNGAATNNGNSTVPGSSSSASTPVEDYMPKTYKRLIYYAEEPNVGRGYIKEPAFSADGRLVASPFGFGVRFLAFSEDFKELCDTDTANLYANPKKLIECGVNIGHRNVVLCARFSPTHLLMVTGCLGGRIAFHQPVL